MGGAPVGDDGLTLEVLEDVPELALEVVKEGGVVGAGLEAEGLQALGHGDGVQVGLGPDDEAEAPNAGPVADAQPLAELGELALELGGGKVGGHGAHALADPAHHALAQLPPPQRIPVLVHRPHADGRLLRRRHALLLRTFRRGRCGCLLFLLLPPLSLGTRSCQRRGEGSRCSRPSGGGANGE